MSCYWPILFSKISAIVVFASYSLDLAHYYILPGFTWDAMLKYMRIRFELLIDIDVVMFIERGIRGGLSQCSDTCKLITSTCFHMTHRNCHRIDILRY